MMTGLSQEVVDQLLIAARSAAERAYAPYSSFPVGAAALLPDGRIVTGCNVENASYPLSLCAERTAVAKVAELGERTIVAIAVTAPKLEAVTPCGGCRQVLNEFHPVSGEMTVILDAADGPQFVTLDELLPRNFGRPGVRAS
jgi:cytidine deaminase